LFSVYDPEKNRLMNGKSKFICMILCLFLLIFHQILFAFKQ
jgi:hypothetical protein